MPQRATASSSPSSRPKRRAKGPALGWQRFTPLSKRPADRTCSTPSAGEERPSEYSFHARMRTRHSATLPPEPGEAAAKVAHLFSAQCNPHFTTRRNRDRQWKAFKSGYEIERSLVSQRIEASSRVRTNHESPLPLPDAYRSRVKPFDRLGPSRDNGQNQLHARRTAGTPMHIGGCHDLDSGRCERVPQAIPCVAARQRLM